MVVVFVAVLSAVTVAGIAAYLSYRNTHPDGVATRVRIGAWTIEPSVPRVKPLDGSPAAVLRMVEVATKTRMVHSEAVMLSARGLVREAADRLERHRSAYPDQVQTRLRLAGCRLALRQYDAAGMLVAEVLRADPEDAPARLMLVRVLIGKGEFAGACDAAKWALELLPDDPDARKTACRAALLAGRPEMAVDHLRGLLESSRYDVECRSLLALCYLRLGEHGKALFQLNEIVGEGTADEAAFFNLAAAYAQQKQAQDVVDVMTRAAARFGDATVQPWLERNDFGPVRESPLFAALVQQVGRSAKPSLSLPSNPQDRDLGMLPGRVEAPRQALPLLNRPQ